MEMVYHVRTTRGGALAGLSGTLEKARLFPGGGFKSQYPFNMVP
jgi:hypothetical protein